LYSKREFEHAENVSRGFRHYYKYLGFYPTTQRKKEGTMKTRNVLLVASVLCITFLSMGQIVQGAMDAVGPTNPTNGFPVWYQAAGITLEQCNFSAVVTDPNCIAAGPTDTPFPGVDFEEAFWFAADSTVAGQGVTGLLVENVEAAFGTGNAMAGQQIVFSRIRIRINVPVTGNYTVTFPYGQKTYNVTALVAGNDINDTVDIGGGPLDFVTALGGSIGPFLQCVTPAPPPGYLGNYNLPCTVTGSPTGNNFFRIQGPGGINVSTNLFSVSGKLFTGSPILLDSSVYRRDAANAGQIDLFATADPTAVVTADANTAPTPTNVTLTNAGNKFFGSIPFAGAVPTTVTLTATGLTGNPTTISANPVDVVTITQAQYNVGTGTLSVTADTSDQGTLPAAVIRAFNQDNVLIGTLTKGVSTNFALAAPPAEVVVNSSAGGSDGQPTILLGAAPPPPPPPGNVAPTITSTPVTTAAVGVPYSYDVDATDPNGDVLTYSLVTAPAGMTINASTGLISWTPTAGQAGPNNVTVRATDPGALFASQSFTVTVNQPDTITVTKAQYTQSKRQWDVQGTSLPAPVGVRTISIDLGPTVGGVLIGTTNVAPDGKWQFLEANSPVAPPSTLNQRISVHSSSGGKLENVPLLIVR
jgi:hypothetical protein